MSVASSGVDLGASIVVDSELADGIFITQHFISLEAIVEDTSSAFTMGTSFAINEVFQILLELPIPFGERELRVVASMFTLLCI